MSPVQNSVIFIFVFSLGAVFVDAFFIPEWTSDSFILQSLESEIIQEDCMSYCMDRSFACGYITFEGCECFFMDVQLNYDEMTSQQPEQQTEIPEKQTEPPEKQTEQPEQQSEQPEQQTEQPEQQPESTTTTTKTNEK